MNTSLDSYLHGPYKEDVTFLNRLRDTIDEVLPIYYKQSGKAKDTGLQTWPYAVSKAADGKPPQAPNINRLSASTHGMILFALDALTSRNRAYYSLLLGKGFKATKLPYRVTDERKLRKVLLDAKKTMVLAVNRNRRAPLVSSGTYGQDDPFTLTWLTEIVFRWTPQADVSSDALQQCKAKVLGGVRRVFKRNDILNASETGFSQVTTSFLKLRRLHLAKAAARLEANTSRSVIANWIETTTPKLWQDFDDRIHRQLSIASMGGPKFDPAELALAFEGALLLHPTWVGRLTIDEVFDALKLSREPHPYWRPVTPFLANEKGHVLFMVSVEVANSVLRACDILADEEGTLLRFSQIEAQLRTYAMWLLGEVEEIADQNPKQPNLVGWRTEYEEKRDMIQLWHTSHVLLFLLHYASLLKRKIAADGMDAAGLDTRNPVPIDGYWADEPLRSLASGADRPYAVLKRIEQHFIEPRRPEQQSKKMATAVPLFSMLLYGPPGTGKTTVAEQMAVSLERPLIIVTVSDFLAAGAAEIENRAKGIFRVLRNQEDVVILFDEIDQFLLDRNSSFYQQQDDVFKFMTPGMLTKLQDLRDEENCIFIVATNYYERIDSAIKRRGRIDEHFLLSIPDSRQRLILLKQFLLKTFKKKFEDEKTREKYQKGAKSAAAKQFFEAVLEQKLDDGKLSKAIALAEKRDKHILATTALFGWGDLKNLVTSKLKIREGMDLDSLVDSLADAAEKVDSSVSLSAYGARFVETNRWYPYEEYLLLLYLAAKSKKKLSPTDTETVRQMFKCIRAFDADEFHALKEDRVVRDNAIWDTVEPYLAKLIRRWKEEVQKEREEQKKQTP